MDFKAKVEDFFSFEIIADEDLFLIVPKLYDVPYKLKLKHLHSDNNKSVFKTEKINETLAFIHQKKETVRKIIYTDYYGVTRVSKKIH